MRTFLVLSICALVTAGNSAPLREHEEALFLRRIADFWEEGEYQIAKNQMEGFLVEFPTSSYADTLRMTLGDLFLREKSYQEAINHYAQISNPTLFSQVFLRRMQCLYHLQWYATLADECEAYLQAETLETTAEASQTRMEVTHLLAIALYEQCLNASREDEVAVNLANRAKPYFEILADSEPSEEMLNALAYLRCILKDFEGASHIYLDLAAKGNNSQDFLFQAALIQSKFDKNLALTTFEQIAGVGDTWARDASYNQLVLLFDLGRYEEITRKEWFPIIPEDKCALAHVILGQSFLQLKQVAQAASEFNAFLDLPTADNCAALPHFVEAAYQIEDLQLLDRTIEKWKLWDPSDPNLANALFVRAELLKKIGKLEETKQQLSEILTQFSEGDCGPKAALSLIQVESAAARSKETREAALFFLRHYPSHEFAPHAWQHLLVASTTLSGESQEMKILLIQDLEDCLEHNPFLSRLENLDIQFYLAKAYFEIASIPEALNLLEPLCEEETGTFAQKANAELLFALCLQKDSPALFCHWAELALAHDATLLSKADQHLALFNAYLNENPPLYPKMAEHLLASFHLKANIEVPNLLWLTDYLDETNPSIAAQTQEVIRHILFEHGLDPKNITPETLFLEPLLIRYAKCLEEKSAAMEWLISLDEQYRKTPDLGWSHVAEAKLMLGETYLAQNSLQLAEALFDDIAKTALYQDRTLAQAALYSARIKQKSEDSDKTEILTLLKNITLQKNLANEPIHLEAAIDYVTLSASLQPAEQQAEKTLDLLTKTKAQFESEEDLLSKDYHAARNKNEKQNQIYVDYMNLIDAKILLVKAELEKNIEQQKEFELNAKELLSRLPPQLQERVR